MEEMRTSNEKVEPVFDESERVAIIARAAALQREEGLTATLSDLERAALESGIEPRFVREAIRLRSEKPETAEITATDESSSPIWRSAFLAAILVPAEVPVIAWGGDIFRSLWGSVVIGALFALSLPHRQSSRRIAFAWPMFAVLTIVVFDSASRQGDRWAVDVLLAVLQGAVALSVYTLASNRRHGGARASSLGRQPG
jgi:hypothetical protein